MAIKQSNIERGRWRDKCREALASHIEKKTGILVSGTDVRLITSPRDPYTWKWLPGAEEIFTRQLSEHSVGTYRKILECIGQTFEAIPRHDKIEKMLPNEPNRTSLIAKIDFLEKKIPSLEHALQDKEAYILAKEDSNKKLAAELKAIKNIYRDLQQEVQSWKQIAQDAEQALALYSDGTTRMLEILQSLQKTDVINLQDRISI